MNMRTVSSLLILLLPAAHSSAEQAYTWIDEKGTTHFSEAPPHNATTNTEVIELLPAPSAGNIVDDDFYSVANQADRMERKRLENEKLIAEKLQAEAETKKANAETQAATQSQYPQNTSDDSSYFPTYPYYPNNGYRPGYGHKPHPGKPVEPEHLPASRPMTSLGTR